MGGDEVSPASPYAFPTMPLGLTQQLALHKWATVFPSRGCQGKWGGQLKVGWLVDGKKRRKQEKGTGSWGFQEKRKSKQCMGEHEDPPPTQKSLQVFLAVAELDPFI